jgi:hypothetical protein
VVTTWGVHSGGAPGVLALDRQKWEGVRENSS